MIEAGSMLRAEWGQVKDTEGQESKRQQHAGKERLRANNKEETKLAKTTVVWLRHDHI